MTSIILVALCIVVGRRFGALGLLVACAVATGFSWQRDGSVIRPEVIGSACVFAWACLKRARHVYIDRFDRVALSWIMWLVWAAAVSITTATRPRDSVAILVWYSLSSLALWSLQRLDVDLGSIVRRTTLLVGAHALFALAMWVLAQGGTITSFVHLDYDAQNYRAVGMMLEPNILGSSSVMWLGVMYFHRRRLSARYLWLAPAIVAAAFATLTRASMACLVVMGLFIAIRHLRTALPVAVFAIPLAGVIAAVSAGSLLVSDERTTDLLSFSFGSGTGAFRAQAWNVAIDELSRGHNWITGFGAMSFPQRHPEVAMSQLDYLSNFWIAIPYDTGVIGAALFLIFLIRCAQSISSRVDAVPFAIGTAVSFSLTSSAWLLFSWICLTVLLLRPVLRERTNDEESAGAPALKRGVGHAVEVGT